MKKVDWNEPLHNRIKLLLKELGIGQRDLAEKIGMEYTDFHCILEKPDSELTYNDLYEICGGLGISIFEFFNSSEFFAKNLESNNLGRQLNDYFESPKIKDKYEIYEYDNAGTILKVCSKAEFDDIRIVLENLHITINDCKSNGGNESPIPKSIRKLFENQNWDTEQQIEGTLVLKLRNHETSSGKSIKRSQIVKDYLNGYHLDYFKNRIAVDTEWNSKDQTFDRDLTAMRAYYEAGVISMGVIITRESGLATFDIPGLKEKYGASTTWMGKLLPRLDARRSGGCPILAIGIKKEAIDGFSTI